MTESTTFYWYDFETFGLDCRRDRPAQFAGIRTDMDLNPQGDGDVFYSRPSGDYLPSPESCLLTGMTPQICEERGIPESKGSSSKTPVPSRMEQKCSVRLFLTTPGCAVFLPMQ